MSQLEVKVSRREIVRDSSEVIVLGKKSLKVAGGETLTKGLDLNRSEGIDQGVDTD